VGAPIVRAPVSDIPPPDAPAALPSTRRPPRPDPPSVSQSDEATTLDAGGGIPKIFDPLDDDEAPTRRVEVDVPDLTAPSSDDSVYEASTSRYVSPGRAGPGEVRSSRLPLPAAGAPPPVAAYQNASPQQNAARAAGPAQHDMAPQHLAPHPGAAAHAHPRTHAQPQMIPALPAPPIPQSAVITSARRSPFAKQPSSTTAGTIALVVLLFMVAAGVGIVVTLWWMKRGPFTH
jgi:hypothetical protein